jgi:hypothetical protein
MAQGGQTRVPALVPLLLPAHTHTPPSMLKGGPDGNLMVLFIDEETEVVEVKRLTPNHWRLRFGGWDLDLRNQHQTPHSAAWVTA